MGTSDWLEAAMRGHSMALSGLWAALLMMVFVGVVEGQDYSGTMQCSCDCASDCASGDPVTCDCPEPAYACAPGFTQVCPLSAGACPTGMSPMCPGGGAPPTTTTTTTTTPPPALVDETVNIGQVKCGKVKYQCKWVHCDGKVQEHRQKAIYERPSHRWVRDGATNNNSNPNNCRSNCSSRGDARVPMHA